MASLRNLAVLLLGALAQPTAVFAAPSSSSTKQVVPGKYIVQLKSGISARDVESHLGWVRDVHKRSLDSRDINLAGIAGVQKTFHIHTFNAYAGEFDEETLAQIKSNPDVLGVEEDQIVTLIDGPGSAFSSSREEKRDLVTANNVTWGLGAISHSKPGSTEYVYDSTAGEGIWAYVVDSGVRTTHEQFQGRAIQPYNALEGTSDEDNMGHGTHVAGTIAGATVGIARKANIVAIKAFDNNAVTTTKAVMDAFAWAVNDIISKGRQDKAVVNLSVATGYSQAFNDAVNSAFAAGVLSVVSAGNTFDDAGTWSPGSAADALTVGAVDLDWKRWYFSSFGSVLDLFAPGKDIISAAITSDSDLIVGSGTSMAAPHVTGVAVYLLGLEGGSAADISKRILELAHPDVVEDPSGSPNFMLYNGSGA